MGIADKFKSGGGGFLSNVDGVIVDYKFTTDTPWENNGKATEKKFTDLFVVLTVREDGKDEDATTTLRAGVVDGFDISNDGHTLTPEDDTVALWGNTEFSKFYTSMVNNGLEDVDIPEGEPITFEHIIGARVRFVQVKDEEAMSKLASWVKKNPKNAAVKAGKYNDAGQRKSKDGKYYDQRSLEVSQVYSTGNAVSAGKTKAGKPAVKAAGAAKTPVAVKGKTKAAASIEDDVKEFASSTLVSILSSLDDNKILRSKLNLAVTKELVKHPQRDTVRKFLYEDGNLAALVEDGVIELTKAGADQVISLAE